MANKIEYMKFASDYGLIKMFLMNISGHSTVSIDASVYGFDTYKFLLFEFYLGKDNDGNQVIYMNIVEKVGEKDILLNKYLAKPTLVFLNEVNKFIERLEDENGNVYICD